MIVLIGGEKGGTGKSTLATNLAVWLARQGRDVLLLDADRQSTSAAWAEDRSEQQDLPPVHCVQRYGNLVPVLQDLRERYAEIVIDAGGRDSEELRTALVASNKLYSPLRASQSDLKTVSHLTELVEMARGFNQELEARMLISLAPTNPKITEVQEARDALANVPALLLSDAMVCDRKVYRDAMLEARGVMEMDDPKAKSEIELLTGEIYG
jgi:chromosome partitioning protein